MAATLFLIVSPRTWNPWISLRSRFLVLLLVMTLILCQTRFDSYMKDQSGTTLRGSYDWVKNWLILILIMKLLVLSVPVSYSQS